MAQLTASVLPHGKEGARGLAGALVCTMTLHCPMLSTSQPQRGVLSWRVMPAISLHSMTVVHLACSSVYRVITNQDLQACLCWMSLCIVVRC